MALVKDVKRAHTFKLACKGVEEMFFAASSEEDLAEWMSLLTAASKRGLNSLPLVVLIVAPPPPGDDFPLVVSENKNRSQSLPEGIYNVPRSSAFINDLSGLYDVPRSTPLGMDLLTFQRLRFVRQVNLTIA